MRYDTFNIKCARGLEAMLQTQIDSGSMFLELNVEFSRPNEGIRTSTSFHVQEARTVENVNSLMTQLYGGFTNFLESSSYDISKSLIRRHSSVSTLDFNNGRENTE